ncbi:MAG: hypothetical protein WA996_04570, partial [Candidatus Promineifilaceae bacterium]
MRYQRWVPLTLISVILPLLLLSAFIISAADASTQQYTQRELPGRGAVVDQRPFINVDGGHREAIGPNADKNPAKAISQYPGLVSLDPTTMTLSILSTPWLVLDHNDPTGSSDTVPNVYVVQAAVTNTGFISATGVVVSVDYGDDPDWTLLIGEDPDRAISSLAPSETYYAYWFATYTTTIGASHQYTVSVTADNAAEVSTSENHYETPEPGKTAKTEEFLSTANSGAIQTQADVVVGVTYVISVVYDLGNNPNAVLFSPVGNLDFDASASRLLETSVRFYTDTVDTVVNDRLYFPTLPLLPGGVVPDRAEIRYTLIPLKPVSSTICSYAGVGFHSNSKYDQFFCDESRGTVLDIEGTLSFSLTKSTEQQTILQGEGVTYTLRYTNNGTLPLEYVWIW